MTTKDRIYKTAVEQFLQNGVENTSVRNITDAADTNSGLMHYYFKSKKTIALKILETVYESIKARVKDEIDEDGAPHIFLGVIMKLHLYTMLHGENRKFYIDCLKNDYFEAVVAPRCEDTIYKIVERFGKQHSLIEISLIESLTIGAQRTIILKTEENLIDYSLKDIGSLEYRIFLSFFAIAQSEIIEFDIKCIEIADMLLKIGSFDIRDICNIVNDK